VIQAPLALVDAARKPGLLRRLQLPERHAAGDFAAAPAAAAGAV